MSLKHESAKNITTNGERNPFARTLLFYYLYMRNKLADPSDLEKVVRKYRNKPMKLITDLQAKYDFPVPETAPRNGILRILRKVAVPIEYLQHADLIISDIDQVYNDRGDIYSDSFSVDYCLENGLKLVASDPDVPAVDNLSRVRTLLPAFYLKEIGYSTEGLARRKQSSNASDAIIEVYAGDSSNNGGCSSSSSSGGSSSALMNKGTYFPTGVSSSNDERNNNLPNTASNNVTAIAGVNDSNTSASARASKHPFADMADYALYPKRSKDAGAASQASPLLLIRNCVEQKIRVRIIIRRKNCVRGSLEAFIRAFDMHFNLLLFDVDEEYITNKQRKRVMKLGRFVSRNNVMQRHLPQLLLRGDNVVLISKIANIKRHQSSSSSGSSSNPS